MLVQILSGLLYSSITKQTEHLGSCVAWGFILLTSSTLTLFRHQFFIMTGSMDKDLISSNHRSTPPVTWNREAGVYCLMSTYALKLLIS